VQLERAILELLRATVELVRVARALGQRVRAAFEVALDLAEVAFPAGEMLPALLEVVHPGDLLPAELVELGQPPLDRLLAERHVVGNSANAL
jgi:hypothetical protein